MAEIIEQIVARPEELGECLNYLAGCGQFGFDTEFVGEDTYHPHLCLIQVATAERLILIDPLSAGPLDGFWQLVVDPGHQVIVHAGREEVRLCRLWGGRTPGNLFDTQIAAALLGLPYPIGHGTLVDQLLHVQLTKAETLTEWRNRPLTRQQIRYAFDDVRYLIPLWQRLSTELSQLNRFQWAAEEFARLAVQAVPDETVSEKWRKLRGLGSLDRRRLAIARALFQWREEEAARSNRPARSLIRDDLIVEIARRNPMRERDLDVVRGLPKRNLAAIVQAAESARELPVERLPAVMERELDPPQLGLIANVLTAVLGDFCSRRRLASNFVATSSDIKLLVRSRLQGVPFADSILCQGWRGTHVLPELEAILAGRRWLRIADVLDEAPFAFESVPPQVSDPSPKQSL